MRSSVRFAVSVLGLALTLPTAAAVAQYGPPPPHGVYGYDGYGYAQDGGWEAPPNEMREVMRAGFHDGIEGARHDFDNHRRPDVRNRDEFRHPHVRGYERHDYREGFRRGYDVGVRHLYEEHGPRRY